MVAVLMFMFACPSFAVLDAIYDTSTNQNQDIDNRNDNDNRNTNTNLLGNEQEQGIFDSGNSDNDNRNTNLLGNDQDQGQTQGQGQGQGQGQFAVGKVNVEDNSEYKSYAFSPPAIHAQKGTSSANMYSIFGGIGLSQTEEYTIAIEKIAVIERMEALGYLTKEEAIEEARETFEELDSASQPKRVLGIFGKTRGRHLLNLMGLISFDSFYKEGQKPFSKSAEWETRERTVDTLETYTGNEGITN